MLLTVLAFGYGCSDTNLGPDPVADDRPPCVPDESHVEVLETASGLAYVRTPEKRFENLADFPYAPNYVEVDGLRMHYVDEGPADGEIVLLLHGQPTWSYLYRKMIRGLADSGRRVIAPDFIGLGRSDKPIDLEVYTYDQHTAWAWEFIQALDLHDVTLFGQDWGGIIGLRLVGEHPERFARVVAGNTTLLALPPGGNPFQVPESTEIDCSIMEPAGITGDFNEWIEWSMRTPDFRPGDIVEGATEIELTEEEERAYNAPFPSLIYTSAIRRFPTMVALIELEAAGAMEGLSSFDKPFMTLFGALDPVLGGEAFQRGLISLVPGARGPRHDRFAANHFLQEDVGPDLADAIHFFMLAHPIGRPVCWVPLEEDQESQLDCPAVCEHVVSCHPGGMSDGACRQVCGVVEPYLTEQASSGVMPCMTGRSCDQFTNFGTLLDGCMPELFPTLTAPAGNAETCQVLSEAVTSCDPENVFAGVCSGLSFVFTAQTFDRMSECADAPCDELRDCLLEANCTFTFDNRGAIPDS